MAKTQTDDLTGAIQARVDDSRKALSELVGAAAENPDVTGRAAVLLDLTKIAKQLANLKRKLKP